MGRIWLGCWRLEKDTPSVPGAILKRLKMEKKKTKNEKEKGKEVGWAAGKTVTPKEGEMKKKSTHNIRRIERRLATRVLG